MGYERTHSFQNKDSRTSEPTTQFRSRPFAAPVQMKPKEQQTPEDLKNEAFNKNKFEAFGLQLKEESGTITPVEQERLGVLQAKMDDFWAQRKERASRSGFDISKVSFTPREGQAAPQLQPMWRQGTLGGPMEEPRSLFDSPQQSLASPLQAKLTIGEPGDQYEQEADRVASQVVKQINSPDAAQSTQGQSVQRQEEPEEELQRQPSISDLQRSPLSSKVQREAMPEEEDLQAKSILQRREALAGGEAATDLESAINSARGGGQPIDAGLQRSMGQAMGADFSGVRVHTDAKSDQLNQSIQAKAFTTGQEVFFRQGEYNPGSREGQELIAHELTHVVQQNGGTVMRSPLPPQPLLQHPDPDPQSGHSSSGVGKSKYLTERKAVQRARRQQMSIAPNPTSYNLPVLQRQAISLDEAEKALQHRAPAFYAQEHEIITPWGEEGGSNCHGYTVHSEVDQFVDGGDLLNSIGGGLAAVVFVRNGVIAHSGRLNGDGTLTHLLIGVGVLRSTIGESNMGYDGRYTLPEQRAELEEYLRPEIDRQNAEAQVQTMVSAVYRALNHQLEGADQLSERVFFLQDNPDTVEREAIINEYNEFMLTNAAVMQQIEDDNQSNDNN